MDNSEKIHGKGLNGYRVRSWGDLVAVATLLALFLSVLAWGLKLEAELNTLRESYGVRIANLEARVADGILPRAEERINNHARRLDHIENELGEHEDRGHR